MIFTDYRFLLDVHEINSQISLSFKQGDTGRVLYITLTENGDIFNIPQGCVAVFTALKPDGTIIFNDCEINGNEITYTNTAQTAAVTGKVDCELRLYGAGNTLITSPHFTVFVHPTVYADQIESKDEVNTLTNLISEANALIASVNAKLDNGDFIPKMEIGTVTTLPAGSMATASFTGTGAAPVLNLGIPMGEQGQAETVIPDAELSLDSTKPVQNRVVTEAMNDQKATFEEHRDNKENPHGVTKAQLGLGNVDDTADMDKPVSTEQAAAMAAIQTAVDGLLSTKAETETYKGTFLASRWSGSAPYTQQLTINGILLTDYPFVDIDLSDVTDASGVIEGWKVVGRVTVSADNTVIAYCYEEKPTVNLPVVFKVVR